MWRKDTQSKGDRERQRRRRVVATAVNEVKAKCWLGWGPNQGHGGFREPLLFFHAH